MAQIKPSIEEAEKMMKKADKSTKLSFTRWSVDWNSATLLYEQAAIAFRFAKENTKAKEAFEKAATGQERLSSPWQAAKHLESAGALAKELQNWNEVADYYRRACELYTECGKPQPASDALARGARALEDALPDEAVRLYIDSCGILEDEGKEQMAFDIYRDAANLYLKLERYSDAATVLLRWGLAADKTKAIYSQCKAYLSAIIVYLYAHDFKQAEQCYNDCSQINAFSNSEQNYCAEKLLQAYREADVEDIKHISQSNSAISNLDHMNMIDAVAICGLGFKAPTDAELSGYLLDEMVEDMRVDLKEIRKEWIAKGCTIMTDGWTDRRNRTLLNFLVSCGGYTMFIKSIDASAHVKNATYLCETIEEVIAEVGEENVIQVVTDNAANYVAAGKLLMERHPTIFWSPCAAHCIDLMLEEIGKLEFVKSCVERAKNICKFIYNHAFVLSTMRKYTGGKELARPGITRFASNFITLQSLLTSRDGLRSMFVGQEWICSSYATTTVGLDVADCIFDEDGFWKPAREILKIIRLARKLPTGDMAAVSSSAAVDEEPFNEDDMT